MKRLRTKQKKCKQNYQQKRIDFHLVFVESIAWIYLEKFIFELASFIVDKNVLKKPFNSKEEEEQEKNLPFKKKKIRDWQDV